MIPNTVVEAAAVLPVASVSRVNASALAQSSFAGGVGGAAQVIARSKTTPEASTEEYAALDLVVPDTEILATNYLSEVAIANVKTVLPRSSTAHAVTRSSIISNDNIYASVSTACRNLDDVKDYIFYQNLCFRHSGDAH